MSVGRWEGLRQAGCWRFLISRPFPDILFHVSSQDRLQRLCQLRCLRMQLYPVLGCSKGENTRRACTILMVSLFIKLLLSFEERTPPLKANLSQRILPHRSGQRLSRAKEEAFQVLCFLRLSRASPWRCPRFCLLPLLLPAPSRITPRGSRGGEREENGL